MQKVGACLNQKEIVQKVIEDNGGIAQTADFTAAGVKKYEVAALCKKDEAVHKQLFCQEEFLRRLERSSYAENLVWKGGLFLYSLTDFDSRVTQERDAPCFTAAPLL